MQPNTSPTQQPLQNWHNHGHCRRPPQRRRLCLFFQSLPPHRHDDFQSRRVWFDLTIFRWFGRWFLLSLPLDLTSDHRRPRCNQICRWQPQREQRRQQRWQHQPPQCQQQQQQSGFPAGRHEFMVFVWIHGLFDGVDLGEYHELSGKIWLGHVGHGVGEW